MERFLLYLDDLDDLYGIAGLLVERVRRFILGVISISAVCCIAASGAWLAMVHPPIALATSTMMAVILLYRTVTSPQTGLSQTA